MKFYILDQDAEIEGSAAVDGLPDFMDPIDWMRGKIMPAPPKDLILNLSEASGDYRGDIIDGLITLYHDALKNALTAFGIDNIQYFPVKLRNQPGSKRPIPVEAIIGSRILSVSLNA